MHRGLVYMTGISVFVVLTVIAGVTIYQRNQQNPSEILSAVTQETVNLGITYLPVNAGVASLHNLQVNSGVLVTEVLPGSLADRAGLKPGDVIIDINGYQPEATSSLIDITRRCRSDEWITLRVWRGQVQQMVQINNNWLR